MIKKFIYYQEDDVFIGWLEEFPDYKTQGDSYQELLDNLKDLYIDLTSGAIPHIRKIGKLQVAWKECFSRYALKIFVFKNQG